jgi:2-keto-3-deoxy-L-rhamnonate aldolase RhmA
VTGRFERSFRDALLGHERMLGTFIKSPSVQAIEILGDLGFDFVVVDEEHGPFDRGSIDLLMLATKAADIAGLVRVADMSSILAALDMGASGVLVPHVDTAEVAAAAVDAARYRGGSRGYSPSSRAGRYGSSTLDDHVRRSDAAATVIVMIEHPDAVGAVDEIAAVEGVDALFLGIGDLAVASGASEADTPDLRRAARYVAAAAARNGKALIATASSVEAGAWLLDLGTQVLVVSSDQGMMRARAATQLEAFRTPQPEEVLRT